MSNPTTGNAAQAADRRAQFVVSLRGAGLRITAQRRAVCDYLAATQSHPSPYQVYAALSATHPEISRATVYNTLNTLRELGAIVEISLGAGQTHYDTNTSPHINLICLSCDQVTDYHGSLPLDAIRDEIVREVGFVSVAGKVELMGFCPACRERRRAEIRRQATGAEKV